ncbi:MAG: hypothetical protein HY899_02995 [Deltaproteobacteria bacterium]|nr:hypothetical protein [Deltaproteobacteria bacterium]
MLRFIPVVGLVLLGLPAGATAGLVAVGHEFRPTAEQRKEATPCTGADGVTTTVRFECYLDEHWNCTQPGEFLVEWTRDGTLLAGPIKVNIAPSGRNGAHYCAGDGAVVVVWEDADTGEFLVRAVDRDGPRKPPRRLCVDPSCSPERFFDPMTAGPDGGFALAWVGSSSDSRPAIWAQRLLPDGSPRDEPRQVSVAQQASIPAWGALAVDADGRTVLAWLLLGYSSKSSYAHWTRVRAIAPFDAAGGGILTDGEINVSELRYGLEGLPVNIRVEESAGFVITWYNWAQAGQVARRVMIDDDPTGGGGPTTTTTTTTTMPEVEVPTFLPAWPVATGSFAGQWPFPPGDLNLTLGADRSGRWLATWTDRLEPRSQEWPYGSVVARSDEDARRWSAPIALPDREGWIAREFDRSKTVATDSDGVWIIAWPRGLEGGDIDFRRSTDEGLTWSESAEIYAGDSTFRSEIWGLHVAAGGEGRWVAAWTEGREYSSDTLPCAVRTATSADGGRTWGAVQTLYESRPCGYEYLREPRIVADRAGNWLVAWSHDHDGLSTIMGSRSSDDAGTWSVPARLLDDDRSSTRRLDLVADGENWAMAFVDYVFNSSINEGASRVLVSRSYDSGRNWSVPVSIAPWHGTGAGADWHPSLASDGDGLLGLAWTTYEVIDDKGLDADIVISFSADHGATWSTPRLVDRVASRDTATDMEPKLVHAGDTWGVLWRTFDVNSRGDEWLGSIRFARSRGGCGDGVQETSEECDDGNGDDGDGCDSNCLVSGCGNQVAAGAEDCDDGNGDDTDQCPSTCSWPHCGDGFAQDAADECDDGNDVDTDSCLSDCTLPVCGDGHVWAGVEDCEDGNSTDGDGCDSNCLATGCGNQVTTDGEECDDGNAYDTDSCLSSCRASRCGDGFVRDSVEACDDGNDVDTDACPSDCTLAACGDGYVREGVEGCDNGYDNSDYGDCLGNCSVARCGDGYLHLGVEECEDGNRDDDDRCTNRCSLELVCGHGESTERSLTTGDALRVLRNAVGLDVECPVNRCDADRNGRVTVTDALLTLRWVVGLSSYGCDVERSIVLRLASSEQLGALQVALDYRSAAGDISATNLTELDPVADCELLAESSSGWAMALDPARALFRVGIISMTGIQGPTDLLRCSYRGITVPSSQDFNMTVEDAVTLDLGEIDPQILVVVE